MTGKVITGPALHKATEDACVNDDASRLPTCIDPVTLTRSKNMQMWLSRCLRYSAKKNATGVMKHLIDLGADAKKLTGGMIVDRLGDGRILPSRETLQLLIEHGWDINCRGCLSESPLLWYVVDDTDLVQWCLAHGAEVDPADDTPSDAKKMRKPILEVAAMSGNIATFELLRSTDAPLSYNHGVLPSTVMVACDYADDDNGKSSSLFRRSMDMVRYLVEDVGCDVNSDSHGTHYGSGSMCSTPLCWIACHTGGGMHVRELVCYLLDHGGDLDLAGPENYDWTIPSARVAAETRPNQPFLDIVAEWEVPK